MWIRSQDKKSLTNANEIWVMDKEIRCSNTTNSIAYTNLGNYDTEQRAIEVLDEIQEQILENKEEELNCMFYSSETMQRPNESRYKVFQMPEK